MRGLLAKIAESSSQMTCPEEESRSDTRSGYWQSVLFPTLEPGAERKGLDPAIFDPV